MLYKYIAIGKDFSDMHNIEPYPREADCERVSRPEADQDTQTAASVSTRF
jgi:hypothetical protein